MLISMVVIHTNVFLVFQRGLLFSAERPRPPSEFRVHSRTSSSISLIWIRPSNVAQTDIVHYLVEYKVTDGTRQSSTIYHIVSHRHIVSLK